MSRSLAWVAKGPALETYETKIHADLDAILANIELPEGAPLFLKLYMIGRDESSANPVVMVCCVHRVIRKEAELSIRESRILDRFPGFGLGSSALLLESHGLEELLTLVRILTVSREICAMLTSFRGYQNEKNQRQSNEEPSQPGSTLEIYGQIPHELGGTIKFVSLSNGKFHMEHTATGGPIFQLDTELYQITAGHGMYCDTPDAKIQYSASELDECEFDGQSDFNDDITTSVGSVTPEELSPQSSNEDSGSSRVSGEDESKAEAPKAETPKAEAIKTEAIKTEAIKTEGIKTEAIKTEAIKTEQQTPGLHTLHTPIKPDQSIAPLKVEPGSTSMMRDWERIYPHVYNPDLDYVLFKLPAQFGLPGSTSNLKTPQHGPKAATKTSHVGTGSTRILVVTPHESIPGTISPETTSYKMRGFTNLQQLLTVQLNRPFLKGYSGAAVVDLVTGAFYGQIILGNPGHSMAYCVSAPSIFADILSKTGHVPILDERQWQLNSQYNNRAASTSLNSNLVKAPPSSDVPTSYSGSTLQSASPERRSGKSAYGVVDPLDKGHVDRNPLDLKRKRVFDDPPPPRSTAKRQARRTFACPLYLHDRLRHSSCLNIRLTRLSDVRKHLLERAHNQVVHCPVCGARFTGPIQEARRRRDAHVQAATCEPSSSPFNYPGITEDVERRIREIARNTRTNQYTEVQRWYTIWDFLFPGAQRPDSPFLTDVADIQRVSDWAGVIFSDTDRWLALPNDPWTPAMSLQEQKSRMTHFIESFIAQARDLVGQNVGPVEDDRAAEDSSHFDVGTPDPSGAAVDLGVASPACVGTTLPVHASRATYLTPLSPPRSGSSHNSHILERMDSASYQLPASVAPIPPRPLNDPAADVPQDTEQGATPEEATGQQDPTLPTLIFQDFATEDFFFGFEWPNPANVDENTGPDDDHAPTGEGGPGGRR